MQDNYHIETSLQQELSAEQAYQYRIVPVEKQGERLVFKTDNDLTNGLQQELEICQSW